MPIAQEWFIDYNNQLIVHASNWVYYTPGTGTFTVGETLTFNSDYTAILVYDNGTDRMNVVYLTGTFVNGHDIEGGTSGATGTVVGVGGTMQTTRINYDNLSAASFTDTETITIGAGSVPAQIIDNTEVTAGPSGDGYMDVVYLRTSIADNDTITGDDSGATASVDGAVSVSKTTYTARQLYSFVQDTFDELVQMDDTVPMSAQTPTEFTMINNWFIDDESTKYLSGGAIATSGWDNYIRVLTFQAGVAAQEPDDIGKTVTGGTTLDTGTLLAYNNTTRKWWVRPDDPATGGDEFDVAEEITVTGDGAAAGTTTGASGSGEDLWANIYTLGTIQTTPNPQTYVFQDSAALSEWWGRGDSEAHIDVLIKVKEADVLIDAGTITVFVRQYADLYDHFPITLATGGRNAVPLATQADLNNNETGEATLSVASATGFTVGEFVLGGTSGAYAEILAVDTTGNILTVGNIVGGSNSPRAFTNGETLTETIDGTASGTTGTSTTLSSAQTNTVAGYSDIQVVFVNQTLTFDNGQNEPELFGTITDGTAEGIILEINVTGGDWSTNDAAGTMVIGNWNGSAWTNNNTINQTAPSVINSVATVDQASDTYTATVDKAFEQGTAYPYNVIVNCNSRTMAQVYEWFKYVTREDANSTQANYQTMYRINDAATAVIEEDGEEYIYAQTTYTPSKASPFGTFAGGKLFAARGVWVENMATADRQNFQLIDANGSTRVPPNFITITVNSVSLGDKVSVFRTEEASSTVIDKDQFAAAGLTNLEDATTFVVSTSIPSDTPTSGYIRVVDSSDTSINRESRYAYSSWTGSTFTLSGSTTLDRTYSAGEDKAYVPYYDDIAYPASSSVSVTVIYSADQSVLTRVRQYDDVTPANSILPFQITGTVSSSGYTVAAIRTVDTIVT